jgi:hypothetical protein
MAGVRIPELAELPTIEPSDNFIVVRNNRTRRVAGNAFYQAMSGVKSAFNLGAGQKIFKGTVAALDGTQGTSLQFNSLSAGGGLELFEAASNVNIVVQNQGINNLMLEDGSVDAFKIANDGVAPFNMGYTGAIVNSNISQANFLAYTNNTNYVWSGFSVPIQAQRTGSVFNVKASFMLGSYSSWPYVTIMRRVNGVGDTYLHSQFNTSTPYVNHLATHQADYSWGYTGNMIHIDVWDQTINAVAGDNIQYFLYFANGSGGGAYTYIGLSYYWAAYVYSPSNPYVMTPTIMSATEVLV